MSSPTPFLRSDRSPSGGVNGPAKLYALVGLLAIGVLHLVLLATAFTTHPGVVLAYVATVTACAVGACLSRSPHAAPEFVVAPADSERVEPTGPCRREGWLGDCPRCAVDAMPVAPEVPAAATLLRRAA